MLSEDLRRRIAALNRGTPKYGPQVEKSDRMAEDAVPERPLASSRRSDECPPEFVPSGRRYGQAVSLDEVVQGQVIEEENGRFLLIERSLGDLWKEGGAFQQRHRSVLLEGRACTDSKPLSRDMQSMLEGDARTILYLDIETTGLSGSPLFLVGMMHYVEDALVIKQLFARDYSEEPHLLKYLMRLIPNFEILVSYNGKAFDLPYIRDRSVIHRVPFQHDPFHLDLLHEARRRWRMHLPDCRLQTLERTICHRVRMGDIPGSEIPRVYHDFVRAGNAIHIRDVLHHNALDLITMSEVLVFMLEGKELGD